MMTAWKPRAEEWARKLGHDIRALSLAYRHPNTPWYAKAMVAGVVAYAVSPIDLIPDFIPVIGYLDDLILLPFGIWLAIKMIPPDVLAECRAKAANTVPKAGWTKWLAMAVIIVVWVVVVFVTIAIVYCAM